MSEMYSAKIEANHIPDQRDRQQFIWPSDLAIMQGSQPNKLYD